MNDISGRIEFLIKCKFPPQGQHSQKKIEAYQAELEAKSAPEISVLYDQEREKEQRKEFLDAVQRDNDTFFNGQAYNDDLAHAKADLELWSKADYWTLYEASALLLNIEPKMRKSQFISCSPIETKCKRMEVLLIRAVETGQIDEVMEPIKYIQWADRKGYEIPPKLKKLIEPQRSSRKATNAPDAPLPESERNSLLKMIYGMAIDAYGYKPGETRNTATGENKDSITSKLDRLGLKLDADTVRKFLKEAETRLGDPTQNPHKT